MGIQLKYFDKIIIKRNLISILFSSIVLICGIHPSAATAGQADEISALKKRVAELTGMLKELNDRIERMEDAQSEINQTQTDTEKSQADLKDKKPSTQNTRADLKEKQTGVIEKQPEIKQTQSKSQHTQPDLQDTLAMVDNLLDDRLQVHGTLSQGYLKSDGAFMQTQDLGVPLDLNTSTFHYNEFAINFSLDISDRLRAGLQLMSRDFLVLMDNHVYLDWAQFDYAWKNEANFQAGRLKVPLGLYNKSRDVDAARTSIFLPEALYAEIRRSHFNYIDGFGIYGSFDLGSLNTLNYSTVFGDADLERKGYQAETGLTDFEGQLEDMYSIQIMWDTPLEGLKIGGTYLQFDAHVFGNLDATQYGGSASNDWYFLYDKYNIYVSSLEYTWEDLVVAAEYQETRLTNRDNIQGNTPVHLMGWYFSTAYRFNDWFASEIYYSEFYRNIDDKNGEWLEALGYPGYYAWQKDWSFNFRFDITENFLLKAGFMLKDGLGVTESAVPASLSERYWKLYQLKATAYF